MKTAYRLLLESYSVILKNRKKSIIYSMVLLFVILEAAGFYLAGKGYADAGVKQAAGKQSLKSLSRKNELLKEQIRALSPKGVYLVVDTANNRLYLRKGQKTSLEAVISSGSGNVLTEPSGERTWVFDTPRGERRIQAKVVDPDWIKPDWAFVEDGEKIPERFNDRVESGVLGKYALSLGDGYLIHGTLYTRLLGRNVTHGCIRMGDSDLETVYRQTPIGARVLIF